MLKLRSLLFNLGPGFLRSCHTPELIEGVHVERQVVQLAPKIGDRRIHVAIEGYKPVYVIPDFLITGVKDVGAILVHVDPRDILAVNVAPRMLTLVDHQHRLAGIGRLTGKYGAE